MPRLKRPRLSSSRLCSVAVAAFQVYYSVKGLMGSQIGLAHTTGPLVLGFGWLLVTPTYQYHYLYILYTVCVACMLFGVGSCLAGLFVWQVSQRVKFLRLPSSSRVASTAQR